MDTQQKSKVALAKVVLDLTSKGHDVFLPIGESPIDLITNSDKGVIRFQVKYCGDLKLRNYVCGRTNKIYYDDDAFDYYAAYLPLAKKVVYVPRDKITSVNKINNDMVVNI